ncbi:MAG: hypothetical protein NXI27_12020 [Alphaproteobacteria bacterium]|nr:hypothetical protein [Alphaproteobacteria bacterium]
MSAGHAETMSATQAASVWLMSFLMAAGIALALSWHAPVLEERMFEDVDTPVIVIGSSLTLHAVSPFATGQQPSLLGDGRAHTRLAVMSLTERESLGLLRQALASDVETVLVEANPFIIDVHHVHQAKQHSFLEAIGLAVLAFSQSVWAGAMEMAREPTDWNWRIAVEPGNLDDDFTLVPHILEAVFPLTLHPPSHPREMRAIAKEARRRGIEIILVAPPRPEATLDILGPETAGELAMRLTGLAAELDLPLFHTALFWPDDFFVDQGHLNSRGRHRFMSELAAWSKQRL